jgi:hypothetical protein
LTDREIRTVLKNLQKEGKYHFLCETTSRKTQKISVFKILTESFSRCDQVNDQQKNEKTTSKNQSEEYTKEDIIEISDQQKNEKTTKQTTSRATNKKVTRIGIEIKKNIKNIDNARSNSSNSPGPKNSDFLFFCFELKKFVGIEKEDLESWKSAYPEVDLGKEISRATEWILSNPSKRKKLWRKFLTGWLKNENDKIENRKAYASQNKQMPFGIRDRRNFDDHGNPVVSEASLRF